jgi:hypothetical protein
MRATKTSLTGRRRPRILRRAAVPAAAACVAAVAVSASAATLAPAYSAPRGGPELSVMAFTRSDLPGAAVERQGYVKPESGFVAEYDREFSPLSVRLGGKRILGIENDVLLARDADTASLLITSLELGVVLAGEELAKSFAKETGLKVTYVKVAEPRSLGVGSESMGAVIRIGTRGGELRMVIAGVRIGRVDSMYYFLGMPRAKVGLPEARTLARIAVKRMRAGLAPSYETLPVLTGVAQEGQTLNATTGAWLNVPRPAYQWQRCDAAGACAPIQGATLPRYLVTTADVGSSLQVVVSGRNAYGSARATSAQTAPVSAAGAPASTAPPTISGTAANGQTLTAGTGTWNGDPTALAYQWRRCTAAGTACTDIPGATLSTYVVAGADGGSRLRVVVVATNAVGSGTAISAATNVVT